MSDNLTDLGIGDSASQAAAAASKQGKEMFSRGVKVARQGARTARDGIEYASEHLGDGIDLVKDVSKSLSEYVSRQPLIAVAGAFIIGYMAARVLRKVSS